MENRVRKKEFVFPEDVQSDYNPIKGISLKDLVFIIAPFILLGAVIIALPPYNLVMLFIRSIFGVVIASIGFAIVLVKPIPHRKNITLLDWMKFNQSFNHRQKLYFIKEKRGRYRM